MNLGDFTNSLLLFLLPFLKAIGLALVVAFANEGVVEAIKVAVKEGAKKTVGEWALVISMAIPAVVVAFFGLDFFKALPLLKGADPVLTGTLTIVFIGTLSNLWHAKFRKPQINGEAKK